MSEGVVVRLEEGEYLLRKGAKGGDIYLIEAGSLEIVDSRQSPEIIMEILGPGRIVGEMAFVDEAPRSADVRAVEDSTVRHWSRGALLRLLEGDASLSSRFFHALSSAAVDRLRIRNQSSRSGSPLSMGSVGGISAAVAEEARDMALRPRTVWRQAEESGQDDTGGTPELAEVASALRQLVDDVEDWLSRVTSVQRAQEAGSLLRTELRHWLVRSRSGMLGVERGTEYGPRLSFLAHLLLNRPEGTDAIGECIDRVILDLPTPSGLRRRMVRSVDAIIAALPQDKPAVITILQPSCGALLARLLPRMVHQGGAVNCVDGDPEVLAFVDAGMRTRPVNIELHMVHQDLVSLSEGKHENGLPSSDVIVLNGLVDHLPARLIGSLLIACRDSLRDDGVIVLSGMAPSKDARFMDHMLRWPLMRRTHDELAGLCAAAGLTVQTVDERSKVDDVGLVLVASVSANGQS